jgi:hypothetical protein
MQTTTLIILIAIFTVVISMVIQYFMRDREMSPATKRLLRILFITGVATLILVLVFILIS